MDDPLLLTKLAPPRQARGLISRPRLLAQLDGCLSRGAEPAFVRRLTLVSAPAGYGKTTLIADWAGRLATAGDNRPRFAWLALDDEDNEPRRFLAYLLAAVQQALPAAGR